MKHLIIKIFALYLFVFAFYSVVNSQNVGNINLPDPDQSGGRPLMQCLKDRQSSRDFSSQDLSLQELSDLLWAAKGINRPETGKFTAPTALNKQNMELFVVLPAGIYKYEEKENRLSLLNSGNFMKLTGKQNFVDNAALNIIIVSNLTKLGDMSDNDKSIYSGIHAGAIMQNIYLYCASAGLNTVTRRSFDPVELSNVMLLNDDQMIVLCQTVGYK